MGTKMRHFKALTKKNWINYKRTPIGNCIEFICPLTLTIILYALRGQIPVTVQTNLDLGNLRHGLYPVIEEDSDSGFKMSLQNLVGKIDVLNGFMVNGGVGQKEGGYVPFTDPIGPMAYFPLHCSEIKDRGIYKSPKIGFIRQNNVIQQKVMEQVLEHFSGMGTLLNTINSDPLMKEFVVGGLSEYSKNEVLKEAEAYLKAYDSQINFFSGEDRQFSKLQFPNMAFEPLEFKDKNELDAYIEHPRYGNETNPAVCFAFTVHQKKYNKFELELFFNDAVVLDYRSIPPQDENAITESQMIPHIRSYSYYSFFGFAYLQNWTANQLLRTKTGNRKAIIATMTVPMRMMPLVQDNFMGLMLKVLPWFLMLMFIPLVYRVTYRIVKEKELGTKELMTMMGMNASSYWFSWLFYFTCVNTLLCTTAWTVLFFGGVLRYTSIGVIYFTIWLFGEAIFGYIMFCQSFFTEARPAAVVTTIVYFGSAISLNLPEFAPFWQKCAMSIFPTACMTQICKVITGFELNGKGIQLFGVHGMHRDYRNFNVQAGFTLFIFTFFLLNILGVYFGMVMPRKFGRRENCCFCLTMLCKSNSGRRPRRSQHRKGDMNANPFQRIKQLETRNMDERYYEEHSPWIMQHEQNKNYLEMTNVMKQYPNGFKAVNGLNLKMYADQIFVLLGHNGAGKSSTISVLTGLYEPTEGEAEVFGIDMFKEFRKVREILGICPQFDIIFDLLTPEEHLDIFYDFKGGDMDPYKKKNEIDTLLEDVGLEEKRNFQTAKLSGGNQRKLSVAMALCGGSKLIILDEPTSTLDLSARRLLWNMLKEYRKDRIILLTTHYMDEADILGDRIGIMVKGKVTCLGSSLFLKKKFGCGYNLTMLKASTEMNSKVLKYAKERLGENCKLKSQNQNEIIVEIPNDYFEKFTEFFASFDKHLEDLDVVQYGISITTLEDVFLLVGHSTDPGAALDVDHNLDMMLLRPTLKKRVGQQTPGMAIKAPTARDTPGQPNKKGTDDEPEDESEDADELPDPEVDEVEDSKRELEAGLNMLENRATPMKHVPSSQTPLTKGGYTKGKGEKYSLAESSSDLTFFNNFSAVVTKRLLLYQSLSSLVYELLVPILIMAGGVSLTSIDFFTRSESKILSAERISPEQPLRVLIDGFVKLDNDGSPTISDFIKHMPDKHIYDFVKTDARMPFEQFDDFVYYYGQAHVREMPYLYSAYSMYEADTTSHSYKFYTFVNMTNSEAVAIYPQAMYESILRIALNDTEFDFKIRSTPFPISQAVKDRKRVGNSIAIIFMTAVAFSMLVTSIVGHVVSERVEGFKHMQLITGLNLAAYWSANFFIDFLKLELVVGVSIISFQIAKLKYMTAWITFLLFPMAVIPFTYVTSFMFGSLSAAQTGTMFFNFGIIVFGTTLVHSMRWMTEWEIVGDGLHYYQRLLPQYTIGASIYFDSVQVDLQEFRAVTRGNGLNLETGAWTMENVLGDAISLIFNFFFYFFLLIVIESGWTRSLMLIFKSQILVNNFIDHEYEEDDDVQNERTRMQEVDDADLCISVRNFSKVYQTGGTPFTSGRQLNAVENLTFGLSKGECFALLGVNGAGKTTIFKSITAHEQPTQGSITIEGMDVVKDFAKCRKLIGYCPQFNPIFDTMTVDQNMEYYATLKGIQPATLRRRLINEVIQELDLQDHRKKQSGALSGGNKRKLSVGIALVGNPPIIILDEPSAGMDPEARRFMQSVVIKIREDKTSAIILTSRLVDEAECLSTKMGIMVNGGHFKCLGTAQHIKNKFSVGYEEIEIKIAIPEHDGLLAICQQEFGKAIVNDGKNPDDPDGADFNAIPEQDVRVYARQALQILVNEQRLDELIVDQVKKELVQTYKQAKDLPFEIDELIRELDIDYESQWHNQRDRHAITVSAVIFAEKLFTQRNVFGVIKALCKVFGTLELLEQYGNYMRLKVPRLDKTIGEMFGTINRMKKEYNIDQYSVNQTSLEQIFQSLANMNFEKNVRTFTLSEDGEQLKLV